MIRDDETDFFLVERVMGRRRGGNGDCWRFPDGSVFFFFNQEGWQRFLCSDMGLFFSVFPEEIAVALDDLWVDDFACMRTLQIVEAGL